MKKERKDPLPVLSHLSGIFLLFLGPLIILFSAKDKETKKQAKTALNWQISLIVYLLILFIIVSLFVLFPVLETTKFAILILSSITLFLYFVGLNILFSIFGAFGVLKKIPWKYPMTIAFLKN